MLFRAGEKKKYFALGRCDFLAEENEFVVGGNHALDFQLVGERQAADAVETLAQVGLDPLRFFSFRQNLQQFVVGQEIKSEITLKKKKIPF